MSSFDFSSCHSSDCKMADKCSVREFAALSLPGNMQQDFKGIGGSDVHLRDSSLSVVHYTTFQSRERGGDIEGRNGSEHIVPQRLHEVHQCEEEADWPPLASFWKLYNRGFAIEATLTIDNRKDVIGKVKFRSNLMCEKCLASWKNDEKAGYGEGDEELELVPRDGIWLDGSSAIMIFKHLSGRCYSADSRVTDVLNRLNNFNGKFESSFGNVRQDFVARQIFLEDNNGRLHMIELNYTSFCDLNTSLIFNPEVRVRTSDRESQTLNIFNDDWLHDKITPKLCFQSREVLDAKGIFKYGIVAVATEWECFFSGKFIKRDHFVLKFCVLNTGLIFCVKGDLSLTGGIVKICEALLQFVHMFYPVLEKTPYECDWTSVKNRKCETIRLRRHLKARNEGRIVKMYVLNDIGKNSNNYTCGHGNFFTPPAHQLKRITYEEEHGEISSRNKPRFFDQSEDQRYKEQSEEPPYVLLQPSGTPLGDATNENGQGNTSYPASRNNIHRNVDSERKSIEGIVRTPSLVSFRELDEEESRELLQKKSKNLLQRNQGDVLNPTVKNRTGKPTTKPGHFTNANPGEKNGLVSEKISNTTLQAQGVRDVKVTTTSRYELGGQQRTRLTSAQVSNRPAGISVPVGGRKSHMQQDGMKPSMPSTFARQREIEKKTRKEADSVRAKYREAKHHSIASDDVAEHFLLGGTKTSTTATFQRPEQEEGQADKVPVMAPFKGELKVPRPKRRPRKVKQKAELNTDSTESFPGKEDDPSQQEEEDDFLEDIPTDILDDFFLSDDEDYNYSDLSSLSDSSEGKKRSNRSVFLPVLDGMTVLNFTQNFKFSYFMMPGYVAEQNKKVKRGILKLPVIRKKDIAKDKQAKKGTEKRGSSRRKSNLMRRIEKLNEYKGDADPRMRQ